ncbi:MAG: IS200/IS605 family transposase [bacterium]|nr:IS200/IS605 family transposase [bacterium]
MNSTRFKILIHLIWGTKNRYKYLNPDLKMKLFSHIKDNIIQSIPLTELLAINGGSDHVHCLLSVSPKHSLSWIVQKIKGESSHWINQNQLSKLSFKWAEGFGAFSVSESQKEIIIKYINNQEEHHKKKSFSEEYLAILKKCGLNCDLF